MADETPDPSDTPEGGGPVHYQISITGRQAAAFFLMLLLALGLAFFLGMRTGAAAHKGGDAVSQIAGASDLPVAAVSPAEKGEKPEAVPATTPEPAEKKLGFDDAGPAAPAGRPAATPVATATPVPAPTKVAAKAPERSPEKTAEKTPEKAPEKAQAAAAAPKAYHIQVFATKDGKKADDLVKKLKQEGYKADVAPSPKAPDLFVVRVGPYADKAKAEAARKKILKANPGLKGLMVVPS